MMMDDDAVSIISRQLTAVYILCGVPTRQNVVCCHFVFMTMRFFCSVCIMHLMVQKVNCD